MSNKTQARALQRSPVGPERYTPCLAFVRDNWEAIVDRAIYEGITRKQATIEEWEAVETIGALNVMEEL